MQREIFLRKKKLAVIIMPATFMNFVTSKIIAL